MSRFGERMMRDRGLEPLYVPHGVDTARFRPQPELRAEARALLEIPEDAFLVGMVAANKTKQISRKAFPEAFQAFAGFARAREDAWMFVHTQPRASGGMNLDQLAHMCDVPLGRLRFPPDSAWQLGTPAEMVSVLYQAFDVLLSPSMGEGFGIPILEAQACGVPVIVSDHSAMTELCGTGWLVDGQPWWDELQQSWFHMPFVESIRGALEAAYEARGDGRLRSSAAAFAAAYDADTISETYWTPVLEALAAPREVGPLPTPVLAGSRGGSR
jgi:glycosyltransferase involved in cell wall biosynthesis